MQNLEKLFDKETVLAISSMIEDRMPLLNQIQDFKEKDKQYAIAMESFQNSLSEDKSKQFDGVMRLGYKVDEYYLTLAYFLGKQSGEKGFIL